MAEEAYVPRERRPIAARKLAVFQRLAETLARRGVSANGISLAGMVCGVAAGGALAVTSCTSGWEQRLAWLAGASLIPLRLFANLLDGMVAIAGGKASRVGELYNEVPDRVSDTGTLIGAGYALGGDVVLGFSAACVALFVAYVRALGKAAGAPQEFCGPMAKQQRMALIAALAAWCGLTPADWQPTWGSSPPFGMLALGLLIIIFLGLFTACRRLRRIAGNLRNQVP